MIKDKFKKLMIEIEDKILDESKQEGRSFADEGAIKAEAGAKLITLLSDYMKEDL